jgi:small subunit ribosomal protein S20
MRSAIKHLRAMKEKDKAVAELRKTVKLLDQLAAKGVIHRNQAANSKSKLTKLVNGLQ